MAWILFDYGNVICLPQPEREIGLFAERAGCSVREFTHAYWPHRLEYDRGDLDGATYWQKVGAALGRSFSESDVAELIRLDIASWVHLNDATVALAEDLAAARHRLALLSNAPAEVAEVIARLPFAASFERCAFSCYLRLAKPDPACYHAVLAQLGASPGEVTFLDDRPENVAGAAALGVRAVLFTGPQQARAELARLGVAAPERRSAPR